MIHHLSKKDSSGYSTNDWIDSDDFLTEWSSAVQCVDFVRVFLFFAPPLLHPPPKWGCFINLPHGLYSILFCGLSASYTGCLPSTWAVCLPLWAVCLSPSRAILLPFPLGPSAFDTSVLCHSSHLSFRLPHLSSHMFIPLMTNPAHCSSGRSHLLPLVLRLPLSTLSWPIETPPSPQNANLTSPSCGKTKSMLNTVQSLA